MIESAGMNALRLYFKKAPIQILFSLLVFILIMSSVYFWKFDPFSHEPDHCLLLDLEGDKGASNISRQWWEWTCLIERELDKGLDYNCRDLRKIGNYYICFDEPYAPKLPCLVYSFGIDNDFRFDDKIAEVGCEVFSFDPRFLYCMGVQDHNRSMRVHFFNIGIASEDSDNFVPLQDSYTRGVNRTWKIRTLSSLKKMFGHENRTLDILKLDVETYEWGIMKQLLKDDSLLFVKQMTLEWHIFDSQPPHSEHRDMFLTLMDLKRAGFQQFYVHSYSRYHNNRHFNSQTDNSLVNTMF